MSEETKSKTLTLPFRASGRAAEPDHAFHVLDGAGLPIVFRLPHGSTATIGRASGADLVLDRPWISRRHTTLHSDGQIVRVEDLGSANGTRLRGSPLVPGERVEVQPGDTIELGSTMLVLQRPAEALRPRNELNPEDFEARVDQECARAGQYGLLFSILRVEILSTAAEASSLSFLASVLRASDSIAAYGDGEYEILLVGYSAVEAQVIARRIASHVDARGLSCRLGSATFPRDGHTAVALLASIRAADPRTAGAPAGPGIVILDERMRELHELVERIAHARISVLLLGETGVGKEILAEALHRHSPRASRPFLRLNCGAFTESLLESELFGHERGAFTGATQAKPGLLETCAGGTVFLDEVGELPPTIQVKLLRVLEERLLRRVGSVRSQAIDVRFVSATNRDLEADIRAGRFREDLYFRLNGINVVIPPLRQRLGEIAVLARAFLTEACAANGRQRPPSLSDEALAALRAYAWPGNLRELRNAMERVALLCWGDVVLAAHLPMSRSVTGGALVSPPSAAAVQAPAPEPSKDVAAAPAMATGGEALRLDGQIAEIERERIRAALERCKGNQVHAARDLGISRRRLIARMDAYGFPRPRKRAPPEGAPAGEEEGDTDGDG